MEKRNKVNLIALQIQNHGSQTLELPNDLHIYTDDGNTILPFPFEEGISYLQPELDLDHSDPTVEVEGDGSWIPKLFNTVNDAKKITSDILFVTHMQKHYWEPCTLLPGQEHSGFLVLPVKRGVPFRIDIAQHDSCTLGK